MFYKLQFGDKYKWRYRWFVTDTKSALEHFRSYIDNKEGSNKFSSLHRWKFRTARPTDVDDGTLRRASRDALEGIDIPRGMFDKYRDEIENLRRSRTSLYDPNAASNRQVVAL